MSGRRALCVLLAVSVIASVVIIVVTAALDPAGRDREEGPPEQEPVAPTHPSRPRRASSPGADLPMSDSVAAPDTSSANVAPPVVRIGDVFTRGEDWVSRLRDLKRTGGTEEVIRALDEWRNELTGADREPTTSSLLVGTCIARHATGRIEDARGDLVAAVAAMEPEPGAFRIVWDQGRSWPTLRSLVPLPAEGASTRFLRGGASVRTLWTQDLKILAWSPDESFGAWLIDLSQDESQPELALAAATLWHLLVFTRDLHADPEVSPAATWRGRDDELGRIAAQAWSLEKKTRPPGDDARNLHLRASLRAQVLLKFADVEGPQAERIRVVVRRLLDPVNDASHSR